jgi:hypothetical protein
MKRYWKKYEGTFILAEDGSLEMSQNYTRTHVKLTGRWSQRVSEKNTLSLVQALKLRNPWRQEEEEEEEEDEEESDKEKVNSKMAYGNYVSVGKFLLKCTV